VAIKNSSCESAKLLLQHGAALEAKADVNLLDPTFFKLNVLLMHVLSTS
jgi:hypothetical protein